MEVSWLARVPRSLASISHPGGGHAYRMDVPWRTLTMELDELRSLTREKLQRGELPRDATLRFHQPCFAVWDEERRPLD